MTVSPDNTRITNRIAVMEEWWTRPEYIAARERFVIAKPICERCGRKATTPLHMHKDYISFERYMGVVLDLSAQSGCSICNKWERSNRRPCPECVKKYASDPENTIIHYISQDMFICTYCENPNYIETLKRKKEQINIAKNKLTRQSYRKYRLKKTVVNGKWTSVEENV
jgi:hypothetical protein